MSHTPAAPSLSAASSLIFPLCNAYTETAILAGGCFWGLQALLRRLPGVVATRVGYCGGHTLQPSYATLKGSGHAESVEVVFEPARLRYADLLGHFFQMHDPTTPNRQGNDVGESYRSLIVALNPAQRATAQAVIAAVDASGRWPGKVVTAIVDACAFTPAENAHQDYLEHHPHGYTCHWVRPEWRLPDPDHGGHGAPSSWSEEACRLSINLNKVALVRNTRPIGIPSVVRAAQLCIAAGAQGITLHPRPDARHVRAEDVAEVHALLQDHPHIEFNLEGNPCHNLMDFVRRYRPHQCTFVPDDSSQATSDHGWTLARDADTLRPLIQEAHDLGVRVSLFMDADDAANVAAAAQVGADRVELYTGPWAQAHAQDDAGIRQVVLARFAKAAHAASVAGMAVNAGHDLSCDNVPALLAACPQIREMSIGHAFTADALEVGYAAAVRAYLAAIALGSRGDPRHAARTA